MMMMSWDDMDGGLTMMIEMASAGDKVLVFPAGSSLAPILMITCQNPVATKYYSI